ncbi:hypothetical protein NDU88_003380 [Pleurodeles waltl]|uniref:Secreted protein n=1 Tax=Pleurodeles waltl TaxID=8319 RepID=A0AAV7UDW3_PLEWA|nr:hypothetical protein NDU88_003380 [Pleurodeles waltl]
MGAVCGWIVQVWPLLTATIIRGRASGWVRPAAVGRVCVALLELLAGPRGRGAAVAAISGVRCSPFLGPDRRLHRAPALFDYRCTRGSRGFGRTDCLGYCGGPCAGLWKEDWSCEDGGAGSVGSGPHCLA